MSNPAESIVPPSAVFTESLQIGDCRCGVSVINPRTSEWQVRPYDVISIVENGGYVLEWGRGESALVSAGSAVVVAAGIRRRSVPPEHASQTRIVWMNMYTSALGSATPLLSFFETPVILRRPLVDDLLQLHAEILAVTQSTPSVVSTLAKRRLHVKILERVLPELTPMRAHRSTPPELRTLLDWIDANPEDRPLSVMEMASRCGLSASRFHRVFREVTGMTPHEYQRWRRLESVAELLRATDLRISEIAQRLGHADQFHLSRQFRTQHGISPSAFRKAAQVQYI